jgi:hypothetical protein
MPTIGIPDCFLPMGSLLRVLGTFVGGVLGYGVLLALHFGPGQGEHLDIWQVNLCLHLIVCMRPALVPSET